MPRWKAWLCRFGMPGTRHAVSGASRRRAAAPVSTAAIAPSSTVSAHVARPAVRQRAPGREDRSSAMRPPVRLSLLCLDMSVDGQASRHGCMRCRPAVDATPGCATLRPVTGRASAWSSDGAVAAADGRIVFAGAALPSCRRLDAGERSTARAAGSRPASIDCHTHLVYRRRPRATSSSCGSRARPTRRSRAPAAASSRPCRRRARRARTSSSPPPCRGSTR